MTLTTPALLFPAISLLLLAYTNRFLVLAQLIRQLRERDTPDDPKDITRRQISNLRVRIQLIKWMQIFGVVSFLVCVFSMFSLFLDAETAGSFLFGGSLLLLSLSLIFSILEVTISTRAIETELELLDPTPPAS